MICIIKGCNKESSASISYDVLDVSATENVWVTTEPVYKKVTVTYCKEHFDEKISNLHHVDAKDKELEK